jgi:hypothetical protein
MITFELYSAINDLIPGAKYKGSFSNHTETEYNAIEWLDPRTKPDWADVLKSALKVMRGKWRDEINLKTTELIEDGFYFDDGSDQGSVLIHMGVEEQINLDTMDRLRTELEALGVFVYPYDLKVSDNENGEGNYITLTSADHLHEFFLAGVAHKNAMIASGRALKDSLGDMNRTALEEFEDNR